MVTIVTFKSDSGVNSEHHNEERCWAEVRWQEQDVWMITKKTTGGKKLKKG